MITNIQSTFIAQLLKQLSNETNHIVFICNTTYFMRIF